MKLYGSTTSPYARRIRIFAHSIPLEFIAMDIFNDDDRNLLIAKNPTLKIPFLVDDEQCIFDSRVIFRYLTQKFELTPISWPQENLLTLVDSINDSLVSMFLLSRSDIDSDQDALFFNLQKQRIDKAMHSLEVHCKAGQFNDWHYPSICLFCLLDWMSFRELYDVSKFHSLSAFHQQHQQREDVITTDPR
ncbi:glutathione S-transferase family protein [Thalassotalea sp. HSM 43]|uniref:glutathione S-transferase family protein n=1 Tax=Thalassotalea sp. HSM 43 TaxID=2552945 RepID=UPI001080A991|nr:glutathione S-transferase N-terminal domain-containing protein [Thalassotalea sp. HSM 43]QBY05017.1 glutathione S-transferase family protein [Thalassotalea sp. HSM 43]